VLDQELHRGGMGFIRGPHQRRRSTQCFFGVHVGAAIEQDFHRVDITGARRQHEGSPSERKALVGIGAGGEERRDDGGIAVHARQPERCGAFTVRGLRVRARANQ